MPMIQVYIVLMRYYADVGCRLQLNGNGVMCMASIRGNLGFPECAWEDGGDRLLLYVSVLEWGVIGI